MDISNKTRFECNSKICVRKKYCQFIQLRKLCCVQLAIRFLMFEIKVCYSDSLTILKNNFDNFIGSFFSSDIRLATFVISIKVSHAISISLFRKTIANTFPCNTLKGIADNTFTCNLLYERKNYSDKVQLLS